MRLVCTGHHKSGAPCKAPALNGATTCRQHTPNPKARANARVRAEVARWRLGDATDDPGETLLRLLTQSRIRADLLADELEQLVRESPTVREALVADSLASFGQGRDAEVVKVGEYVRGLASLEATERDRCANFARLALAAGLAERQVRLAERQVETMQRALLGALTDLGLEPAQRREALAGVARHLRAAG